MREKREVCAKATHVHIYPLLVLLITTLLAPSAIADTLWTLDTIVTSPSTIGVTGSIEIPPAPSPYTSIYLLPSFNVTITDTTSTYAPIVLTTDNAFGFYYWLNTTSASVQISATSVQNNGTVLDLELTSPLVPPGPVQLINNTSTDYSYVDFSYYPSVWFTTKITAGQLDYTVTVPEPSILVFLGISMASILGLRRWWRD